MPIVLVRLLVRLAHFRLQQNSSHSNPARLWLRNVRSYSRETGSHSSWTCLTREKALNDAAAQSADDRTGIAISNHGRSVGMSELELTYLTSESPRLSITYEKQRHEADVGNEELVGRLIVDHEHHRHDIKTWTQILLFRARLDGFEGVQQVWQGMRMRQFEIPLEGAEAQHVWAVLLRSTISKPPGNTSTVCLTRSILDHAREVKSRTGQMCGHIHKVLVGGWFRVDIEIARAWHGRLIEQGLAPSDALLHILDDALLACGKSVKDMQTFLSFARGMNDQRLYDQMIDRALSCRPQHEVLLWHRTLLQCADAPSQDMFKREDVQKLFDLDGNESLPMIRRKRLVSGVDVLPLPTDFPPLTRSMMSKAIGDVHGIKEIGVSDNFIARLLATRIITLDACIRAIEILGVDHLDAVAARQLAVRCDGFKEYLSRVTMLRSKGVEVGNRSTFARLLTKFAKEGQAHSFNTLLQSDQHPSNFDDVKLQQTLLVDCLAKNMGVEAQISQSALLLSGRGGQIAARNLYMQHALERGQWSKVENGFRELQVQGLQLTDQTLRALSRTLSAPAGRWKKPGGPQSMEVAIDIAELATNAYLYADSTGTVVDPMSWIDLLKRHGRFNEWEHVEKIVFHLVTRYKRARLEESHDLRETTTPVVPHAFYLQPRLRDRAHPGRWRESGRYRAVFTKQMLVALFVWGLRSASITYDTEVAESESAEVPLKPNEQSWTCGLLLLSRLRSDGMKFEDQLIRYAFIDRMWMIFGPGRSNVKQNEDARRFGAMTLADFVRDANQVWPGLLLHGIDDKMLDDGDPEQQARLRLHLFGEQRRVSSKDLDYFNVAAWVRATFSQPPSTEHARTSQLKMQNDDFRVRYDSAQPARFKVIRRRSTPNHTKLLPR